MQYNRMEYNAMQCNTIQYNAMQCNTMQCNAIQCNAVQYNSLFIHVTLRSLQELVKTVRAQWAGWDASPLQGTRHEATTTIYDYYCSPHRLPWMGC